MKKYDQLLVKISGGDDDKASIISKINDNVPKPEETVPIMAQQYEIKILMYIMVTW